MIRDLELQRMIREKNVWASPSGRNSAIPLLIEEEAFLELITEHAEGMNDPFILP